MRDNDIVFPHLSFAGPDSFYVTNDNFFHFDSTVMRSLWTFLLNYWLHCDIVFFDGFKGVEAIGGVHPNGITMDKDERLVRVSIECGAQRPIGNSERKKKRVCASVVRFSKLMCCFQTLSQGLRFLCPVEWTIFFLNCKWFNNDGCLLDAVALGFFLYIRWPLSLENCFHLFPAIVAWGNGRPFPDATPPHPIGFPAKWCQRNKSTSSILMTCHCTQIFVVLLNGWGKFLLRHRKQSIRSTFQNRVVTRHPCGISALVPQTSFGGKISGDVSFLRLLQSLKFFQRSLSGHRKLSCTGSLYWCISEDEAENFYHAMRV